VKKSKSPKKISIFYFLIFLIVTSIILIIYINNIIYINGAAASNNELQEEIKKNIEANDLLRAEAEKLSSFDRIRSIVSEKFSLSYRENSIDESKSIILKKSQLK